MTASTTGGSCLTAKGLDISLAALQRQDPYINNIVDVASQVALYTFNSKSNEWEKTDVEGTLFVYTRLASPRHGFTIMNRLSMENLTEPITKDLDFQLQDPFLLYRNARLSIHGIWFYDKADCQRIAELMKNLTRQEQQFHQQHQCGWVSPRALDTGGAREVDILQMLNKARNEYDKGSVGSEPKEIGGGGGVIHDNPRLIKPIPLKPTDRQRLLQHKGGDSKPGSLVSLFGSQPAPAQSSMPPSHPHAVSGSVTQPHTGPGPGSARSGVGGRPAVARSLSYDDPSAQAVPVSPGGGPLLGTTHLPPSSAAASSVPPQPCAAIQKLMSGHGGAPDLQPPPLSASPDKRVCENGLQRGGDPLQKLFPNPLSLRPAPLPPPSSSSAAPAPCCPPPRPAPPPTLIPGLQAGHPVEALTGALQQHLHIQQHPHIHRHPQMQHQHPPIPQSQSQYPHPHPQPHPHQQPSAPPKPLFYSPSKPLLPAPMQPLHPLQVSAGVFPAQVGPGGLQPAQVSTGVVSPHELLQRLQLVQQEQNQNQTQGSEPSRPSLAPCFHQPPLQPQIQQEARPSETSSAGPAPLNSQQHFQGLPATDVSTLLMSPSVFSQSKPQPPHGAAELSTTQTPLLPQPPPPPRPEEPWALSRSQLQATLIHLIQNDSSFLDVIYEAYVSRFAKDAGRPRY